ncbi:MAG TPA: hypothetical protein VK009_25550 [Chloroflexota bacterium]|nr:hypothetical protein [Chloroflexota bacterium]
MRLLNAVRATVVGALGILPSCTAANAATPPAKTSGADVVEWTDSYSGNDTQSTFPWQPVAGCHTSQGLMGYEPATPGKYPVLVFLAGSYANYQSDGIKAILQEAARNGFVAVSVEYATGVGDQLCPPQDYKDQCMFGSSEPKSVIATVCSRGEAGCDSKGIVTAGHSQGAFMAYRAKNYEPRVAAAWGMDLGAQAYSFLPYFCGADPSLHSGRAIASNRIRLTFGAKDWLTPVDSANALTGKNCTSGNCLSPDGSGWYQVQPSEVSPGNDDGHCVFSLNGCSDNLDPQFAPPSTKPWSLDTNLQWLKGFVNPGP